MTTTRLFRWAPLLLVAVLATGCSGGASAGTADKTPEIATLTTAPPSGTPSSGNDRAGQTQATDPDAGRPRERIDMTDADRDRLYNGYLVCLKDNGIDVLSERAKPKEPGVLGSGGRTTDPAKAKKANAACANKLPLPAWEIDAKNPDAIDFGRKVVACLKNKGVKYVELSTGTRQRHRRPVAGRPAERRRVDPQGHGPHPRVPARGGRQVSSSVRRGEVPASSRPARRAALVGSAGYAGFRMLDQPAAGCCFRRTGPRGDRRHRTDRSVPGPRTVRRPRLRRQEDRQEPVRPAPSRGFPSPVRRSTAATSCCAWTTSRSSSSTAAPRSSALLAPRRRRSRRCPASPPTPRRRLPPPIHP